MPAPRDPGERWQSEVHEWGRDWAGGCLGHGGWGREVVEGCDGAAEPSEPSVCVPRSCCGVAHGSGVCVDGDMALNGCTVQGVGL